MRHRLLALIAGLLFPLAFAPYDLWPLLFVSVAAGFWCQQQAATGKEAFLRGWLYGLGMFGFGVSWVHVSMNDYGYMPLWMAIPFTAIFAAFLALFYGLTFSLSWRLGRSALVFADTGHLCFATLHATNAYQALERIITLYPGGERDSLLMDLSMNLCAVVSQRLVPRKDGSGHVAAVEILRNLPWFRDLITKGEIDHLQEAMERSSTDGVVTFDQSLYELHQNGQISLEEALRHATSENNLRLRIQLEGNEAKDRQEIGSTLHKVEF